MAKAATTAAILLGAALTVPAGQAADAERGAQLSAQCVACHGAGGVSTNPLFPHLAGQQAGYLQRQLEAFRNGDRYDPLMSPVAQSLPAQDIDDLAAYYSRIGPLARTEGDSRRTAASRQE